MAVVAIPPPQPQHWGIFLPAKAATADAFLKDKQILDKHELSDEAKEFYTKYLSGGQRSTSDRTICVYIEGTDEAFALGAKVSTKVDEIKDLLFAISGKDPKTVSLKKKAASGTKILRDTEECPTKVIVSGIPTLKRTMRQYEHPIFVVGGGLGAIQVVIEMKQQGRQDITMMDKHEDFGGHSWIAVPNKFTKLQTERGTYHVTFTQPWLPVLREVDGKPYKNWPSRDQLLAMMRESCRDYGLYELAQFGHEIQKIQAKKGVYTIQHCPVTRSGLEDDDDDIQDDADCTIANTINCWPGFLHEINEVDFPGEDEFDGYIEYSSFDRTDYSKTVRKTTVLYGHGAFTIENVRTLVEHMTKKIWVVCRRRNLSGTKVSSWLVGYMDSPMPATILLEAFKKMYDLVGFDVWNAHSVTTDAKRTYAQLSQATIFGVTDIYFLAGYYKIMEVVVDEVKRLSYRCVHTKNGGKYQADCFIKAIGTKPSFKIEKQLGLNYIVGAWANGDPLYYVAMATKGVQAKNFGSFSVGPGYAPMIKHATWFVNYPEDWALVKDLLPVNKSGKWPCFVSDASYGTPMFMLLGSNIPGLGQQVGMQGAIKARKQKEAHPLEEYLSDVSKEWAAYIRFFRKNGMIEKDTPDCPYPHSKEEILGWIDLASRIQAGEKYEFINHGSNAEAIEDTQGTQ